MNELKPCPFCGGEAETHETIDGWIAACGSEQSELDGFTHKAQAYGTTEAEAIEAWNTRAADKPDTYHDDFYDCESTTNACELTDAFREHEKVDGRSIVIDCADTKDAESQDADQAFDEQRYEGDSREKLEADVHVRCDGGMRRKVLEWLDRQAAITERQQRDWYADVVAELIAERDEWRAKAAEEAANAEGHWRNANNIAEECAARARALDMQLKNIHKLEHERDELRTKVDEYKSAIIRMHSKISPKTSDGSIEDAREVAKAIGELQRENANLSSDDLSQRRKGVSVKRYVFESEDGISCCYECPLFYDYINCELDPEKRGFTDRECGKRPDWCPLKEVP